jgi:hypothetical protein
VSPLDASLGSSSPNKASQSTPLRSKPSRKFPHHGIYDNYRAYKEKLTFYTALSLIMLLGHMVSFASYVMISHSNGTNMPNLTFNDIKSALSNTPLISPPDYDRDYILYLSASAVLVAGVLVHVGNDDREYVIYYISKNISGPPLKNNHEEKLCPCSCPRSPEVVPLHSTSNYQSRSRFQPNAILA